MLWEVLWHFTGREPTTVCHKCGAEDWAGAAWCPRLGYRKGLVTFDRDRGYNRRRGIIEYDSLLREAIMLQ